MSSLSESQVLHFLLQLVLLIVTARVLADLFKRFGQATVIGELLSGIILGTSILGRFAPVVYHQIFPPDAVSAHLLEAFSWVGMIMLLLNTGMETDLGVLSGLGRPAMLVSGLGIVIPLVGGFAVGMYLPATYLNHASQRLVFAMFIAVSMAISAVPVIARILIDLDIMRRELGLVILGAGVLDDLIGWLLLSVIAGLAARAHIELRSVGLTILATLAFVAFAYFVGFRVVSYILRWVDDRGLVENAAVTTIIGITFVCAIITQAIGVHAVFGAFVAGLMIGRSPRLRKSDREAISSLTVGFMAPVFFAYSGLQADIFALHGLSVLGLVLGVATLGKYVGCGVGGMLGGLEPLEALSVASGMNARGGMGIVVALLGLNLGVLTGQMYTVVILVAVITSLAAPTLLAWSMGYIPPRRSELERAEHERILNRVPFVKEGAKLLVLDGGGPNTQLATHLAGALGNHPDASITIFSATENGNSALEGQDVDERFTHLKSIAQLCGVSNVYQKRASGAPLSELFLKEARRGYDAIFAGAALVSRRERALGGVLGDVLREAPAPIIIARHSNGAVPFKRVLVPTNGALYSTLGVAIAMYYANSVNTKATAMYVVEDPRWLYPGFRYGRASTGAGQQIIDEVRALGTHLELDIDTQIGAGAKPEDVIQHAIDDYGFDLLVMGVLYRSVEERVYFGPKVDSVLREAKCAAAVVVFPEKGFVQGA